MTTPTPSLSDRASSAWAHVHHALEALKKLSVIAAVVGAILGGWYIVDAVRRSTAQRAEEKAAAAAPVTLPSQPQTPPKRGGFLGTKNVGGSGREWLEVPRPLPPILDHATGEQRPAPAECPASINVWRAPDPESRAAMERKYTDAEGHKRLDLDKVDLLAEQSLPKMRRGGSIAASVAKGGRRVEFTLVTTPEPSWETLHRFDLGGGLVWAPTAVAGGTSQKLGATVLAAVEPLRIRGWYLRIEADGDYLPMAREPWRGSAKLLAVRRWDGD